MDRDPSMRAVDCSCRFRNRRDHHDRLRRIEEAPLAELSELLEMAVTWGELEYETEALIDPDHWLDFVEAHEWRDEETVTSLVLSLMSVVRQPVTLRRLASVTPLRSAAAAAAADGHPLGEAYG